MNMLGKNGDAVQEKNCANTTAAFKVLAIKKSIVTDPLEAKSIEIAEQVREFSRIEKIEAIANLDFGRWLRAQQHENAKPSDFKWILDLGNGYENYSFDDFKKDYNSANEIDEFRKKAKAITALIAKINQTEPSDTIDVAFQRLRLNKDGTLVRNRAVVRLPEQSNEAGFHVYEPNGVACAEHHCDILYKLAREQGGVWHLPFKNIIELRSEATLKADLSRTVEFKDVAAEMQNEKLAAEREITRGLMGYYSNLRKYKVPAEFI